MNTKAVNHKSPAPLRFAVRVEKTDTCWLWLGRTDPDGYGHFGAERRDWLVHRWSYEYHVGPIPDGLDLDHLCRVRNCVNPEHLEPVTRAENSLRGYGWGGVHARQTHCINGHEFTPENTYRMRQGGRSCRKCAAAASRRYRARRAARRSGELS